MTFVGKILVIVIMVFALLFLGLTTVVFTTSVNWKQATEDARKELSTVRGDLTRTKDELTKLNNDLTAQRQSSQQEKNTLNQEIERLNAEIARRQEEITKQRTAVETAQENVRAAQDQAEAYFDETKKLRTNLAAAEKQADEFKVQQTELNEQIRLLQRELEVAKNNNRVLRERNVILSSVISQNGLDPDPSRYQARETPPDVDGEITRADDRNRRFEISIGSDDGLVVGHELLVYRYSPQPEFLGRVRVQSVEEDKAVVTVIGNTPLGKKIREGDIVSTKIRPRS